MNVGVQNDVYAVHLLDLARTFAKYRGTWSLAPAMAGRPSILERRVSAMLNSRLDRRPLTRFSRWASVFVFLAIALPIAAFAQTSFGSVYGVVVDQMDRVLPGTAVIVTDSVRSIKHEVRTDRDGR